LKKLRWQLLVVLLAMAAISILLLSQQSPNQQGPESSVQPVVGGKYTEALVGSLGRLNPVLDYYNSVDYEVDRLLYSSLVRYDPRGLPHGDLAETWGISQDGKVYNFSLRADAVWHDGQPVVSDDIVFTVDLLRQDGLPIPDDLRDFWKQIDVEALDEKTIQFRLPEPFSPFLDYLTFGILPKHLLVDLSPEAMIDAPFNLNPVGSGQYRIESLDVQDGQIKGIVLDAFNRYYGSKPFIEKIVFRYFPDEDTALAALEQGDVMGISQITAAVLPQALQETRLQIFTARLPRFSLIYLNLDDPQLPFFQDSAVRKALLLGVNRRWIVDRVLGGQAIIANGPIFPDSWAYYGGIEQVPYDPDAAVAMLKEAGYTVPAAGGNVRAKDGVAISFELAYPEGQPYEEIAARVQQDWRKLGIEVKLQAVPYDELLTDYLEPRTYQAVLTEINLSRSADPDPYPFWHQSQITSGQNYSGWDDRQVSEYLEQARVQEDFGERAKRYRNFQVRFSTEMPALPLYYPVYSYGVDEAVHGVSVGPLYDPADRFTNIAAWYLLTGTTAQVLTSPVATP
jgi:peptide/nickel transport system substrate-binding protein